MKSDTWELVAGSIATTVLLAVLIAGLFVWSRAVWRECRVDHSVTYCLRLLI